MARNCNLRIHISCSYYRYTVGTHESLTYTYTIFLYVEISLKNNDFSYILL